ncbi:hypothetical protein LCGC14_0924740 [marine sediment metagenome]|uniref:Uncharacterized protein n=1 Tax=marine sediment metagenome TaxID=412755 RepID=A0A0F9NUK3_9ZZZZ
MPKTSQIKISNKTKKELRKIKHEGETFESAFIRWSVLKGRKKKGKKK